MKTKRTASRQSAMFVLECDYCGAKKDSVSFVIGYSVEADWTMWIGTGLISCPECDQEGRRDSHRATHEPTVDVKAMTDRRMKKGACDGS